MAHFQQFTGTISMVEPSRTFTDGVLYSRIQFAGDDGSVHAIEKVFATDRMTAFLKLGNQGRFFVWNAHFYAFSFKGEAIEDIDGARRSFFKRDARLLLLLSLSIVALPFTSYILIRKFVRAGSRQEMQSFFSAAKNVHA